MKKILFSVLIFGLSTGFCKSETKNKVDFNRKPASDSIVDVHGKKCNVVDAVGITYEFIIINSESQNEAKMYSSSGMNLLNSRLRNSFQDTDLSIHKKLIENCVTDGNKESLCSNSFIKGHNMLFCL